MNVLHYLDLVLEIVGALGLVCSAASRLPLGKASAVLEHLGTNFLAAVKEARDTVPARRITIPPKADQ